MLSKKPKKCTVCGHEKLIWTGGMCAVCARLKSKPLKGTSTFRKKAFKIKRSPTGKSEHIRDFYSDLKKELGDMTVSIESNTNIPHPSSINMAHIFPKGSYPSVATNKDNIVILTWEEHTRFDELLGAHRFEDLEVEFPNSWDIICDRARRLLPMVKEQKNLRFKFEEYLNGV